MRLSRTQLTEKLKAEGLTFSEFSFAHEGNYMPQDADWNYKDLYHIENVHQLVLPIFSSEQQDMLSGIYRQKIPGLTFFLSVAAYQPKSNALTYHMTWLFFVLIIESVYDQVGPNRTRVTTTYSVGGPWFLSWTFPIIKFLLKRNYNNLMSGDIPMRERRGQLRSWGYDFHRNQECYTFIETIDIQKTNVLLPKNAELPAPAEISLAKDLARDGEKLYGRDDVWGLRIVRSGENLCLYPRMCPHEGASLDCASFNNKHLRCPWHGRMFNPAVQFNLNDSQPQRAATSSHQVSLENQILKIEPIRPE